MVFVRLNGGRASSRYSPSLLQACNDCQTAKRPRVGLGNSNCLLRNEKQSRKTEFALLKFGESFGELRECWVRVSESCGFLRRQLSYFDI
jgi:hypothetical protein